jgi:hypothetical protein
MTVKFRRTKQSSQLLLISSLFASSALISNVAHAETQSVIQNPKNDSSLIQAIGNDPMIVAPSQKVQQPKTGESAIINQINQELVSSPTTKKAQGVSSVSQLSDVRPTDWAFTALQSLVERYGCIAGYPDSTFRGKQATSRYEFAAGLNACLDKINEIISAGLADKVSKEDLATLQKLQEEFAAELATLRGRVDALDAKTAKLEAQQFSTTTKLYGQAIFGLQGRFGNSAQIGGSLDPKTPDPATNVTFGQQVQLSLVTQFSDRSLLLTGLQVGNLSTAADPLTSLYALNNGYNRLGYEANTANTFVLSDLTYRFLPSNNLALLIGARGVNAVNVFRGPNRVESAGSGPLSLFAQRNPIIGFNAGQAGLGFDWQINKSLSLQAVYSAGDAPAATGDGGLFGGNTSIGVQLAANLFDRVDLALYYLNSYTNNGTLNNPVGDNIIGSVIPASRFSTNAFGSTISWNASKNISIGGWLGFTTSDIKVPGISGSVETFNWMAFSNFLDIFREGDLLGIYVGQPPKITSSNLTAPINYPSLYNGTGGVAGSQTASTTHLELFYRYPVSKNISITPGLIFLFNPGQTAGSDTVTIGALRTTFSF